MKTLFVVEQPLPFHLEGADVALASDYLSGQGSYSNGKYQQIVNLCDYDRYQGQGYYVSLLAEARGHRPLPIIKTIEDLNSAPLLQILAREIEPLIRDLILQDDAGNMAIDAYFGRDPTGRHSVICQQLFALVKAPLFRARLKRGRGKWQLAAIEALKLADIPAHRHAELKKSAEELVGGQHSTRSTARTSKPSIAILYDGPQLDSPSNEAALQRFVGAAEVMGMKARIVSRDNIGRLQQYDGLFIRETTHLNHYTYELSRKASALGLVVVDDPDSILLCNNKVYLHELLSRHQVAMPRSMMVYRDNVEQILPMVGLPCILKQPDSAFSMGVVKVETEGQLQNTLGKLFEKSDLVIAQEFLPTAFDWRVGILDRRVLYVCKYFMAPHHWQVIKHEQGSKTEGKTTAVTIGETPEVVISTALKAANLIGSGLYGVDLKQVDAGCYVMEINDNPNVDAGNEDGILGDALYREIMGVIKRRIAEGIQPALQREAQTA